MLIHDFFAQTVARAPEAVALVCEGRRVTYGELAGPIGRLAATLQALGVVKGDRVAIFLDNGVEAVVAIYAALAAGAVFMPVSPQTKADKLRYLLTDVRPRCLITHAHLERVWAPAVEGADSVRACVVAGGAPARAPRPDVTVLGYVAATAGHGRAASDPGLIDQDLACLIYTSGSTGDPKGVMITHLNMVTACVSIGTYLGLRGDDVILSALPLSFNYGLYQVLLAFRVGATVMLERSFAFPVKALELMAREGVTVFPGVPTMFALLLGLDLGRYDLRRLRVVTNAGAALPAEHIRRIREAFPQAAMFSMYGLTECTRVTYLPPDQLDARPGSVGRGMPNEEWWLEDDAGRRLPFGSTGELVVRGSHVMRGYWNKPEATARRLRPGPMPGELVLHAGDVFRTDDEGYLYFVARKDDVIKSRGEKVSPREIENELFALEGVREAAVIGVDDALLGQAVKAFVALDPGVSYTERDVIRYCRERFENHMVPKYVEFRAELPKTLTGKIDKIALR